MFLFVSFRCHAQLSPMILVSFVSTTSNTENYKSHMSLLMTDLKATTSRFIEINIAFDDSDLFFCSVVSIDLTVHESTHGMAIKET